MISSYSFKVVLSGTAVVLGLIAFRRHLVRRCGHYKSRKSLAGQGVIICGANSGLGKATAIELAKLGAQIVLACRDLNKANDTVKEILSIVPGCSADNFLVLHLDLTSFDSVRNFVDEFLQKNIPLNILINNAGVKACNFELTVDGIESQMSVNHYGPFLLTNLLINKLKESSPSRIIFVTSLQARRGKIPLQPADPMLYNKCQAYSNSKLANYIYAVELSNRLGPNCGVEVYLVSPGYVWTNLGRHSKPSLWKLLLFWPVLIFVRTPYQGCQSIVHCVLEDGLESGAFYRDCQPSPHPKNIAKHQNHAISLWNHSTSIITKEKTS